MRAFVLYDKDGTITSIGLPAAAETGRQTLQSQSGHEVAEVDLPDDDSARSATAGRDNGADLTERLARLMTQYRIDASGQGPSLVRRETPRGSV
ncbi:hypothetical protein [Streptomyces sp. NPDC088785]|uniref:hypothetical protein n=1 Tax=Streptomyces sp. NPDC088785 TaxID=3365897 RepID=UPI00382830DE